MLQYRGDLSMTEQRLVQQSSVTKLAVALLRFHSGVLCLAIYSPASVVLGRGKVVGGVPDPAHLIDMFLAGLVFSIS